jgi:hypothetical protein
LEINQVLPPGGCALPAEAPLAAPAAASLLSKASSLLLFSSSALRGADGGIATRGVATDEGGERCTAAAGSNESSLEEMPWELAVLLGAPPELPSPSLLLPPPPPPPLPPPLLVALVAEEEGEGCFPTGAAEPP